MDAKAHWQTIYRTKRADEVSWYQPEPTLSLQWITEVAPDRAARIIDVGCGASRLVDRLLQAGYTAITLLDVASAALDEARGRLGDGARRVTWIESDVLTAVLPHASFDVWHDRAVFHFLTGPTDRATYAAQVRRAVRPGGHLLIATFAEDGPAKCSGLPVVRYSAEALQVALGDAFRLERSTRELHVTPSGAQQAFRYSLFQLAPHESEAS